MSALFDSEKNLNGIARSCQGLRLYKSINTAVRSDLETLITVRIVSGGASGHEPSSIGYVGKGMLSAAVCGKINAAPTVLNILQTIKLMGPTRTDILVVVPNCTDNRLNFGLAVEMSKEKYNIEIIFVDDDCSIDLNRVAVGRRGMAGIVIIHKICGAMAERGKNLRDINYFVSRLLERRTLRTIGFTFEMKNEKFNAEIGQGELDVINLKNTNFSEIVKALLVKLQNNENDVILLFNNYGLTPDITFNTFIDTFLSMASYKVKRIFRGSFLTSLNSQGISVTVLDAHSELLLYMDYPTECNTSVKAAIPNSIIEQGPFIKKRLLPQPLRKANFEKKCLQKICFILKENASKLNKMDEELGDGDIFTNLGATIDKIENSLDDIDYTDRDSTLQSLSEIILKESAGLFGTIVCLFLQGASHGLDWYEGVKNGISFIKRYAMVEAGDRTVVDVLLALEEHLGKADRGDDRKTILESLVNATDMALENTIRMIPKARKTSVTTDDNFKPHFPDPGAQVASFIIRSIYDTYLEEIDNQI